MAIYQHKLMQRGQELEVAKSLAAEVQLRFRGYQVVEAFPVVYDREGLELTDAAMAEIAGDETSGFAQAFMADRALAQAAHAAAVLAKDDAITARTAAQAARDIAIAQSFAGSGLAGASLDTILTAGVYRTTDGAQSTLANGYPPLAVGGTVLLEVSIQATVVLQRLTVVAGGGATMRGVYMRRRLGTTWTPWYFISTQRTEKTAGIATYAFDEVSNRDQLIYGDTGWRDITLSTTMLNGWTVGTIFARRKNCWDVEVLVENLQGAAATSGTAFVLPVGFGRNIARLSRQTLTTASGGAVASYRVDVQGTGGTVVPAPFGAGTPALYGALKFSTVEAWPTTLPGTASASIPNV